MDSHLKEAVNSPPGKKKARFIVFLRKRLAVFPKEIIVQKEEL